MGLIESIDYQILAGIITHVRCNVLTPAVIFITRLGDNGFVWLVLAAACLAHRRTRACGAAILLVLALGLLVGNMGIKQIVARPRPFQTYPELVNLIKQGGYSFPSAHSMSSFAAATVFCRFAQQDGHAIRGIPPLVLAALIALSRLYVCVHYPSDVLCGALLGIALAFVAVWLTKQVSGWLNQRRPHEKKKTK